jgi:hypothetical protein
MSPFLHCVTPFSKPDITLVENSWLVKANLAAERLSCPEMMTITTTAHRIDSFIGVTYGNLDGTVYNGYM